MDLGGPTGWSPDRPASPPLVIGQNVPARRCNYPLGHFDEVSCKWGGSIVLEIPWGKWASFQGVQCY